MKINITRLFLLFSIPLFAGILPMNTLSAQNAEDDVYKQHKKLYKEGRKYMAKELYNLALPYFLTLQQYEPDNSNFNYCVGTCYYNSSIIPDSAIYYLSKATNNISKFPKFNYDSKLVDIDVFYLLGIAYMRNYMTETAINHFRHYQKFLDTTSSPERNQYRDVEMQIARCQKEKNYAKQAREAKSIARDSLQKEIGFYRDHYEGTTSLLVEKDAEISRLKEDLTKREHSKVISIAEQFNVQAEKKEQYTIQLLASEQEADKDFFSKAQGVEMCRMANGLYYYTTGTFATRKEAEALCKQLRLMGYKNAWIRPVIDCKR